MPNSSFGPMNGGRSQLRFLLVSFLLLISSGMAVSVSLQVWLSAQVEIEADLRQGLVAYWRFDEGEGDIAFDETGNHNDGALLCAAEGCSPPRWVKGKLGSGLKFDGRDYVGVHDDTNLDMGTGDFTISVWIKPRVNFSIGTSGIDYVIVVKNNPYGDNPGYMLFFYKWHGWTFRVSDNIGQDQVALNSAASPVWTHLVGVKTNDYLRLYADSMFRDQLNISKGNVSGKGAFHIGIDWNFQRGFDGIIDEVRIYNRALTESEIKRLYNFRRAGPTLGIPN